MTAPLPASVPHTPDVQHRRPRSLNLSRSIRIITRNSAAMLGTALAVTLLAIALRADWRNSTEQLLLGWLLERQETGVLTETSNLRRGTHVRVVLGKDMVQHQAALDAAKEKIQLAALRPGSEIR